MRNNFRVFHAMAFISLFMAGCRNALPIATSTSTTTLTPLSTWTVEPIVTLPPLPNDIFNPFPEEFYENTVQMAFGVVSSGVKVDEQILIDSSIGKMTFSVFWRVGDLDVILIQPDGSLIDPSVAESDRNASFTSDGTSEEYWIFAPQTGLWTVIISGKSAPATGSDYMLEASADAVTMISVNFDKEKYSSGDPIKLVASVEDNSADDPMAAAYIHGVTWQVIVEDPQKTRYSFELYDDGLHGDFGIDDGVYANTFRNTLPAGQYNFYIQISGANNREYINGDEGKHFTRVYFRSTVVH